MSTNALIEFYEIDSDRSFYVYQHWDGNPNGVAHALADALPYAWPLPRFEADDFAAAFVAGNKPKKGGHIRMSNGNNFRHFTYRVTFKNSDLWVRVENGDDKLDILFEGSFQEFCQFDVQMQIEEAAA